VDGSNPILFARGSFGISNVSSVKEAKKKRKLLCPPLKDSDFRPAVVLPQALSFFAPRTRSLNGDYELSRTSIANLQC
jgi:hypothetical protein